MTRPAHVIAADLAANSRRRCELETELAQALLAAGTGAPPAGPAPALAEYLTARETAELLGVSLRTLASLRARDDGPIAHRIGRAVRYRREEIEAWVARQERPAANAVRLPSDPDCPWPSTEVDRAGFR